MNVYSVNLGHARPELERSIIITDWYTGEFGSFSDRMQQSSFGLRVKGILKKSGNGYFVKSVDRSPLPVRSMFS